MNNIFECEGLWYNMCKRKNKYRTCNLPRCCYICPKRYYNQCPTICTKYKEIIEK